MAESRKLRPWQRNIHRIIFEADTFGGKLFDILLLIAILASVGVVMLDSIPRDPLAPVASEDRYYDSLNLLEWIFTIFFTIEYIARVISIGRPWKYVFSFFGLVDLLSILPTYLGLFVVDAEYLMVVRTLRLLRVFRVLKMVRYLSEANVLMRAVKASAAKIFVFLAFVLIATIIMGTIMYIIEAPTNEKFTSIPRSIYWAIVTLTTVGYGDIAPSTAFGQFVSAIIMILGYAIIAVPTGIVSSEFMRDNKSAKKKDTAVSNQACEQCGEEGHDVDAVHCKYCGAELNPEE